VPDALDADAPDAYYPYPVIRSDRRSDTESRPVNSHAFRVRLTHSGHISRSRAEDDQSHALET